MRSAPCTTPEQATELVRKLLRGHWDQECFCVLCINVRGLCVRKKLVHKGSRAWVDVHPADVFRPAVACGALSVIVAHNHPSGDVRESAQDIEMTKRLVRAGRILGIDVSDHIIVTRGFGPYGPYQSLRSRACEGLF